MFETFQSDEDGKHYWRLKADNGQIIATGGEGYETKGGAIRAIGTVQRVVLESAGAHLESAAESSAVEAETETPA